jgi:uncharacterized membrane protein
LYTITSSDIVVHLYIIIGEPRGANDSPIPWRGKPDIAPSLSLRMMKSGSRMAISFLVVIAFVMMILGPLASLASWIVGLVLAGLLVPIIVIMGMRWSRSKADADGGKNLIWRGMTEEEWTERRDPDDFEGEID